jgi:hypothetical protein
MDFCNIYDILGLKVAMAIYEDQDTDPTKKFGSGRIWIRPNLDPHHCFRDGVGAIARMPIAKNSNDLGGTETRHKV